LSTILTPANGVEDESSAAELKMRATLPLLVMAFVGRRLPLTQGEGEVYKATNKREDV
jgi:hypothetical protein